MTRIDRGYRVLRGAANTPEHRVLVNAQAGQVVHHINGVKLDNDLDNLVVLDSLSQHHAVHVSLEAVAFELVRAGVIVFDRDALRYRRADG